MFALSREISRSARPLLLAVGLGVGGIALAQTAPPGFVASPEIYKVIAENAKFRVIEVTWKPGQKDKPHSHPDAASYSLTDCKLRGQVAGRLPWEGSHLVGMANIQDAIASHEMENIGTTDCKLIMFEPK